MVQLDRKKLERFKELVKNNNYDALNFWTKKINPKLHNMIKVKRAALLSLASHGDRYGDRGRIHVLLEGEPGTGKSRLMEWIRHKLNANYSSHRTTSVGLTGDMSGDEITKGDLPMSNKGAICVDELDKFSNDDRTGLYESMASGVVTLSGGGKKEQFDAECRVIGGCNRIDGWDDELLDRFDFHFKLDDPSKEETVAITSEIISNWMQPKENYDGDDLREYLRWIHEFSPKIDENVEKKTDKLMRVYITQSEESRGVRHQQGIVRVAYTIAKLNRRDLLVEDVVRAIIMVTPEWIEKFENLKKSGMINGWLEEPLNEVMEKYVKTENE